MVPVLLQVRNALSSQVNSVVCDVVDYEDAMRVWWRVRDEATRSPQLHVYYQMKDDMK